ncbi:MAG: hypothetical protein JWN04_5900 [Myxococcaceae bacterium]|nr:hypothetical protein [Myxococcaceae bacterium]
MRLRILGLVLVLLTTRSAWAQHAAGAPLNTASSAAAKEAFKRGEAAYSAGNYDTAVREWTTAYSADPRPRIQFNLSQAYERMGQLQDALDSLKRFLDAADPEDPTYSDANARYVALQQRLAATGVVVQGGAEGGSILVDDQDWGRTPRPDKLGISPGNHVIVVRWADGREFRTNVYVPAGQVVNITVTGDGSAPAAPVAPTAVTPAAAAAAPSSDMNTPPPAPRDNKKLILYGAGGATAALGVGLLVYGFVRHSATNKCGKRDKTFDLETYCNPDSEDAAKRQSIAGFVTGGVLLAGGAALLVVNAVTGRPDAPQRASSQCGVGLTSASCTFRF